jgi:hypothetical protein
VSIVAFDPATKRAVSLFALPVFNSIFLIVAPEQPDAILIFA